MKKVLPFITAICTIVLLAALLYGEMEDPGTEKEPEVKKKVICVKVEGDDAKGCCAEGGYAGCGMMKGHGMKGCCAKGGDWGMMCGHLKSAGFYLKFDEKIGLSESQIEELKTIRDDSEKTAIRMKAEIKTLMVDLKSMLGEDSIDLTRAKSLIKKFADLKAELHFARLEASVKAREVLTAKQLEKIESLMEEFHKKKEPHGCGKNK